MLSWRSRPNSRHVNRSNPHRLKSCCQFGAGQNYTPRTCHQGAGPTHPEHIIKEETCQQEPRHPEAPQSHLQGMHEAVTSSAVRITSFTTYRGNVPEQNLAVREAPHRHACSTATSISQCVQAPCNLHLEHIPSVCVCV